MKISCISTVYNEAETLDTFLNSIVKQTIKPDEIIITDAESHDETLSKLKKFQKKSKIPIKILLKRGNRSIGRNQAIKHASGQIIVCSDAGCLLDKNWLKNITIPFVKKNISVVSGYYLPVSENVFQKCLATYTCVMPDKIDPNNFLPSSRSIAFRKSAWEKVNGYPEELNTCEDLIFATKLKESGFQFKFVQNALVYWPQRKNIAEAYEQFFSYAVGDGQAHFIRPQVTLLFLRYILGVLLLCVVMYNKSTILSVTLILGLVLYLIWSIQKNYRYVKDFRGFFYLPLLQLTADIAVISGTTLGLLTTKKNFLKYAIGSLLVLMFIMLFSRSVIFTIRIIKDIKTNSTNKQFLPSIQPCNQFKHSLNAEEQHLFNYRSLGVKCKK